MWKYTLFFKGGRFFLDKNEFVYPGNFLAYEEEFMAGQNAFENGDGKVYSTVIGVKKLDSTNHEVSVQNAGKSREIISRGCTILGVVFNVKDNVVLIELKEAELEGKRKVITNGLASLVIFNISHEYVTSTHDVFKIGDIVRARVLDVTNYGIELHTKDSDLGVIKAFGSVSRKPLILISDQLRDPITGHTESRKISSEYALR